MTAQPSAASIGVDVGGTSTRIAVYGPDGAVVSSSTTSTPVGPDAVLDHLEQLVSDAIRRHEAPVEHVGVGFPGRVAPDGAVTMALNLGIIGPVAVGTQLSHRLGRTVHVENDVNAAALGAWSSFGFDGDSSLVYLSIGTGFAAGVVMGGEIVRGHTGTAGEIGHVPAPGSDVACHCGQRGCVEARVSGGALAARALGADAGLGAAAVWDAADRSEPLAAQIRNDAIETVAWACQLAVMMLDVEVVVLGGGVARLGARLLDPVRSALERREAASPFLASIGVSRRVVLAPDGVELGALGAALAARGTTPWSDLSAGSEAPTTWRS